MRQLREWGNCDQGRHILVAVARDLAAEIASRLMRGGGPHRDATQTR